MVKHPLHRDPVKKPNTLESVQPLSGEYSLATDLKLNAWYLVAIAAYLGTFALKNRVEGLPKGLQAAVLLVPLIPVLLGVRSYLRFARGMDEFQRRMQANCWLFAALGTVFIGAVVSVLAETRLAPEDFVHGLGLGASLVSLFVLWVVASVFTGRRFR